jgi:superfamily I DNA/RNA helicase
MNNNELYIACAGAGKTRLLVDKAKSIHEGNVLITTYTQANKDSIEKKFIDRHGSIPSNVTIQTLFSFLLEHGARPYQAHVNPDLFDEKIGFKLVEGGTSDQIELLGGKKIRPSEDRQFFLHYFAGSRETGLRIYSDKLSKFVIRANEKTSGVLIKRMRAIFPHILIDEVQDFSGWELVFLELLLESPMHVTMVGDPRQGTISTQKGTKGKQYRGSKIMQYFEKPTIKKLVTPDDTTLTVNHRSSKIICELSNKVFPNMPASTSGKSKTTDQDGIYLVHPNNLDDFLKERRDVVALRWNKNKEVYSGLPALTFSKSKGLEFEHVLIYPTDKMVKWFEDESQELPDTTRSQLYVALTRAESSIGIVHPFTSRENFPNTTKFSPF